MIISANEWAKYVKGLSAVNKEATDQIAKFLGRGFDYNNPEDMKRLVSYAYGISTKYGEAAAELACQMYDAIGLASDMILDAAVPAERVVQRIREAHLEDARLQPAVEEPLRRHDDADLLVRHAIGIRPRCDGHP